VERDGVGHAAPAGQHLELAWAALACGAAGLGLAYGAAVPPGSLASSLGAALAVGAAAVALPLAARFRRPDVDSALIFAALASAGAAAIHFAVAPMHYEEYVPFALVFALTGVAQLAWALLALLRPTRPVLLAGVLLSAGVVAVWVLTRTVGAPVGPEAGEPEAVGAADLLCSVLELAVIGAVLAHWSRGRHRSRAADGVVAMVGLAVLGATVVGLLSAIGAASDVIPPAM